MNEEEAHQQNIEDIKKDGVEVTTEGPLAEVMRDAVKHVKEMKDAAADRADERSDTSLNPTVVGWRGGNPVAVFVTQNVDRDQGFRAVHVAAYGFGCDQVAFAVDTWMATTSLNPVTGERWGPGEMQDVVQNHQGMEKGWITESLAVHAVNRAGDMAGMILPYVLHEEDGTFTVEWTGDREDPARVGGLIPDTMLRIMDQTPLSVHAQMLGLTAENFGLNDEEAQAHADCAVIKVAYRDKVFQGLIMLISYGTRRTEIINDSLGEYTLHANEQWKEMLDRQDGPD